MSHPKPPIDRERVLALLDAYGADPDHFPEAERGAARAYIDGDPALRTQLREAAELDALLEAAPSPTPSANLQRAVAEIPLRHPQPEADESLGVLEVFGHGFWGRMRLAAGLAAALAAGVAAGALTGSRPNSGATITASVDAPARSSGNPDGPADLEGEAWDEFTALAFADSLVLDDLDALEALDDGAERAEEAL